MCSTVGIQTSLWMGCPIRILKVLRLYAAPLERFAGLRVLLRLQAPRHPPRTLLSLFSRVCFGFDVSFLCFNSCYATYISKIEGISYSVGNVRIGFAQADV
jgi:hypothetical protein